MKSPLASARTPAELAEFLADREGLTGAARERFLGLIGSTFGATLRADRSRWWRIALGFILSAPVSIACHWLRHSQWPPGWLSFAFVGFSVLGVACAFGYGAARRESRADAELHWAAYCRFLRPSFLELLPGLLDRNLPADNAERVKIEARRARSLRELWSNRDEELWSVALTGLALGQAATVAAVLIIVPRPAILLVSAVMVAVWTARWLARNRQAVARGRPGREISAG